MNNEKINELKALRGDVYQERENLLSAIQQGQKQVQELNVRIGELNGKIQEALDKEAENEEPKAKKIKDVK